MTALVLSLASLAWAAAFGPARAVSVSAPMLPPITVGFAQAAVEVTVAADGSVASVQPLGGSPPVVSALAEAAGAWRFAPARDDGERTEARVLLAGIFRPPELMAAAPPEIFAPPASSGAVPRATKLVPPLYPPNGVGDAIVIVEVLVDEKGRAGDYTVALSAGGFDSPALQAARGWSFQPATRAGTPVPGYVYLLFGFKQPVVVK